MWVTLIELFGDIRGIETHTSVHARMSVRECEVRVGVCVRE
jgi:hypothetical protein